MKKLIVLPAVVFIINTAFAQKVKESEIPAIVKKSFTKTYQNSKVRSWEKENGNFEAEFELNKSEISVLIAPAGNIIETETRIKITELPQHVIDYCTKQYAGKKIAEASKIVDSKGVTTYEAEIDHTDVLFAADGTFIKESKDND